MITSVGLSQIKPVYGSSDTNHSNNKKNLFAQNSKIPFRGSESFVDKSCFVKFFTPPLILKKVQQEIDKKFIISRKNENPDRISPDKLLRDNIDIFSNQITDILLKNNINTPNSIIEALEKTANTSDKSIEETAKSYGTSWEYFIANKKMIKKREFLQEIIADISKSLNPDMPLSKSDIEKTFSAAISKTNAKYDSKALKEEIKKNIEYKPDDFVEEKIELNNEEMAILKKAVLKNPDEDISVKDLYNKAINLYVGGDYSLKHLPERIQKAVLTSMPRYKSKDYESRSYDSYRDFENLPVSRWLAIFKNTDEFAKNFEPGMEYSYKNLQSCSKCNSYCENQYRDDCIDMNVKFIIHPRSDVSKAFDIGERKYGGREVIYPPNQKFKILGKKLVEDTSEKIANYNTMETYPATFYRYEIHMQEMDSEVKDTEKVSTEKAEKLQPQKADTIKPKEDIFAKMIDDSYKAVDNTKRLIEDVIKQNLSPETAIINNFDAEKYPVGIADAKGNFCVKDENLLKMFKSLSETIPGYSSIYGRKQHDTHKYTLDVHTFKVLKECVNNPEYAKLSDNDKLVLQMAVLLHDIAKPPFLNDRQHPEKSAIMAENILSKLTFPKEINDRIVNLVKNHNWYEHYNNGRIGYKDVLKKPLKKEDFNLMAIISQGDTKSVNDWFYGEYCYNLPNAILDIKSHI